MLWWFLVYSQSDSVMHMYPYSFILQVSYRKPLFPSHKFVFYAVTDFLTFDDFDGFVSSLQDDPWVEFCWIFFSCLHRGYNLGDLDHRGKSVIYVMSYQGCTPPTWCIHQKWLNTVDTDLDHLAGVSTVNLFVSFLFQGCPPWKGNHYVQPTPEELGRINTHPPWGENIYVSFPCKILVAWKICLFSLFTNLFNHLLISTWAPGQFILYFSLQPNTNSSVYLCFKCSNFNHWKALSVGFCVPRTSAISNGLLTMHFLSFWHSKMLQTHLVYFMLSSRISLSQRTLVPSTEQMILKTKI